MKPQVIIRADGDSSMGMGHLMRCFAVAQMVLPDFDVRFSSISAPESFVKLLESKNIPFSPLGSHEDFFDIIHDKKSIVVLDGYHFPERYDEQIADLSTVVWIDDIPSEFKFANALINHSPGLKASHYSISPNALFCLGADFALLQPEFLTGINNQVVPKRKSSLFICFGGADPMNFTLKYLEMAVQISSLSEIHVAVGAAYDRIGELFEIANVHSHVVLHQNVGAAEMAQLYRTNTVVLVPCSGVLLEALACNPSVISGYYVENQQQLFQVYSPYFEAIDLRNAQISDLEKSIENAKSVIPEQSLFDGNSPMRVSKLFQKLELLSHLKLRLAVSTDTDLTFGWASNPEIRKYAFQTEPIPFSIHQHWFQSKLESADCYYFIAELDQKPVGSIRFDRMDNTAVLSYLIDPSFHGKGLGQLVLSQGIFEIWKNIPQIKEIVGYVLPNNIPSLKAFRQMAFREETDSKGQKFTLTLKKN